MVEPAWGWHLHEQIASNLEAGHKLIELLLAALAEKGWDGSDLFYVHMAAEEAMVNAIMHGNKQAADKTVDIEFDVTADTAFMRFRDQGEGFCPDALPDPRDERYLRCSNGRGVMLIKATMCEVRYNEKANEVTMIKRRNKKHL